MIEDIDAGNYKGEINNDLVCIIELGDIPYVMSERKAMVCVVWYSENCVLTESKLY